MCNHHSQGRRAKRVEEIKKINQTSDTTPVFMIIPSAIAEVYAT
jgi:hypothetical protein